MALFNQDQNDKDKQNQMAGSQLGPANNSASNVNNQPSQLTPQQQQGSGSFTNLKQYLNANKTGGQQLTSGIGSNIQKQIDPEKKQSEDYNAKVAQGIQQAQGALQTGGNYLNTLKGIDTNVKNNTDTAPNQDGTVTASNYGNNKDLGVQALANDPNFNQYQQIQAGNGINENQLNLNQQNYSNAANQYANTANTALQNLGTEGGRFQLLQQAFGGVGNPNYNTGQQRLDQLFLKQADTSGLKNQVAAEAQNANQLVKNALQTGKDTSNVTGAESQLVSDLNNQANTTTQDYVNMLNSYIPGVNNQRQAAWDSLNTALQNGTGSALTADQIKNLGITAPTRAYDVFNTINQAGDVATQGAKATSAQDVATQANANDYNVLAKILGLSDSSKAINGASTLGNAYDARTDSGSLTNRIADRANNFNTQAQNQVQLNEPLQDPLHTTYQQLLDNGYGGHVMYNSGSPNYEGAKVYDQALADFIRNNKAGTVITPTGVTDAFGNYSDSSAGTGNWTGLGGGQRYNPIADDILNNALNNLLSGTQSYK